MFSDLKFLVRLQDLDQRLAELDREVATLPKHIAGIEKKLESHQRRLDADHGALAANQRDRKKLEGDIQIQEQKISKLKSQMLDAKTNEQYRAFQHEIEYCEAEIRKCEDRILELMSESDPLDKNVKAAEESLKKERAAVEREKQQARDRTAQDQKQIQELKAERAQIVAGMNPSSYRDYERVRKNRRGIALAEVVEGRCTACHMAVRLQFLQDLKRSTQLMHCESCGRILYYNPPVEVEDLALP